MKYYCNPMNLEYTWQIQKYLRGDNPDFSVFREAADPSLVFFRGRYYCFPSMTGGFFVSSDMVSWKKCRFLSEMPVFDYAPDICAAGDYLYFCASRDNADCSFYRTKDPLTEPFEEIKGSFPFWDPKLFCDDDGSLYLYWGCSNINPIYGVQLDPETMRCLTEPKILIDSDRDRIGYERNGEDHMKLVSEEERQKQIKSSVEMLLALPEEEREKMGYGRNREELEETLSKIMSDRPFIEGAWMNKYKGKYYLQYAVPGTENNVYGDGCYIGDGPLGPFTLARNNPFSYKPGGFITGAGHGSTVLDENGKGWHMSTMRIIQNYRFERRLGLWKAGIDGDGELYCDQTYGDWPINVEREPFAKPDFMLLSYRKPVKSSSGTGQEAVTDEDIRTCWTASSADPGEWIQIDLEQICDVRAVQINFAERKVQAPLPAEPKPEQSAYEIRYMDLTQRCVQWILEASEDGEHFWTLADKRRVKTDYSHDFLVWEEGKKARYLRLTIESLPYGQIPSVSGLRVFGNGTSCPPEKVTKYEIKQTGSLDIAFSWEKTDAAGYQILWGYHPDKLYHSRMVLGDTQAVVGAFIKGEKAWARIDAFNENGITEGDVFLAYGNDIP